MATTVDDVAMLARAMLDAEATVDEAETRLKLAKERLRVLVEETLPSVMTELGLESLKLATGQLLTIKDDVYVSMPKDALARATAFNWLIDHEGGDLIKTEVTLNFGREELKKAQKLVASLQKKGLVPVMEQNVHPQTLKAFIREQISAQVPIDLALFGARAVSQAKLSQSKKG